MKLRTVLFIIMALQVVSGCANVATSAAEAAVVYIIAKHDEHLEKKHKKYTALDKCLLKDDPEAYALGDAIAYGQPVTARYNLILSRVGDGSDLDPIQPHQLAYAFYIIADEIRDNRAKARIIWIEKTMTPEDAADIRSVIEDKYLVSHLEKCFSVPNAYRITKTTRQFIQEEQLRLIERGQR